MNRHIIFTIPFVQNHYREYMPRLGRYNRVDPFHLRILSSYRFVKNNPLRIRDPKGLLEFGGGVGGTFFVYGGSWGITTTRCCENGEVYYIVVEKRCYGWALGLDIEVDGSPTGNFSISTRLSGSPPCQNFHQSSQINTIDIFTLSISNDTHPDSDTWLPGTENLGWQLGVGIDLQARWTCSYNVLDKVNAGGCCN